MTQCHQNQSNRDIPESKFLITSDFPLQLGAAPQDERVEFAVLADSAAWQSTIHQPAVINQSIT